MKKTTKGEKKLLLKQLRTARNTNNYAKQADILSDLAGDSKDCGDEDEAISYYEECIEVCSNHDLSLDESFVHRTMAEMFAQRGNRRRALHHASLFRSTAAASGKKSQIQLSKHVTGWVYEKLWVGCEKVHRREQDLQEAVKWCQESLAYLVKYGHDIDSEVNEGVVGGKSDLRKAMLDTVCSRIYANMGEEYQRTAERHWNSAHSYAARKDEAMLYDLRHARLDFGWLDPVDTAQRLVNMAPAKKKGIALIELGQAKIYAGNFEGALEALTEALAQHEKYKLAIEDKELLDGRLVFCYQHLECLKFAENETNSIAARRRMYDKMADSLCEFWGERTQTLSIALDYYKKVFQFCSTDKQRVTALVSMAETARDATKYEESLKYFEQLNKLEESLHVGKIQMLDTRMTTFGVKCLGRLASKSDLLDGFDQLLHEIPEKKNDRKAKLYRIIGNYLAQMGEKADDYFSKAKELEEMRGGDESSGDEDETAESADSDTDPENELELSTQTEILQQFADRVKRRKNMEQLKHDINKLNPHGETKLHEVARTSDTKLLLILIKLGYNVNARDEGGWTPLHEAVTARVLSNVTSLLRAKAEVDCTSRVALEVDDDSERTGGGLTPLMVACDHGFVEIARNLLNFDASVVKQNEDGWTAVDFLKNTLCAVDEGDQQDEEVKKAQKLLEDMESRQRKQGVVPRIGPPPKRKRAATTIQRKVCRKKGKMDGAEMYKRAIGRLGKRVSNEYEEVGSGSEDEEGFSVRKETRSPYFDIDAHIQEPVCVSPEPERPPSTSSAGYENVAPYSGGDIGNRSITQSNRSSRKNSDERTARALTQGNRPTPRRSDPFIVDDTPITRKRKITTTGESVKKRCNFGAETGSGRSSPADTIIPIIDLSPPQSPAPHSHISLTRRNTRVQSRETSEAGQRQAPAPAAHQAPPTPVIKPITVKITFIGVDGEKIKTKMIPLPSHSTIADVYTKCYDELDASQQLFDIHGTDDCEMDKEIPLESLDVPRVLVCRVKQASAEVMFKSSCANAPDYVVNLLKEVDKSSKLDLSQHEVDVYKEHIFKAVLGSKQPVKQLLLDNVDLCVADVPAIARMLPACNQWKASATGINDDFIDSLVTALDCPTALRTLNLSTCELESGRSLSCLLRLAPTLQSLHLSNLELKEGACELVETICGLTSLTVLNLSYNTWISAELADKLAENCSERLRELALTSCNLDNFEFAPTYLPAVTRLSLSNSGFSKWESLVEWSTMGRLEWIDLSSTLVQCQYLEKMITAREGMKRLMLRTHRCVELESNLNSIVRMMVDLIDNSTLQCPLIFEFSLGIDRKIRQMTAFADKFLVDKAI